MMLMAKHLEVVHVTTHVSLKKALEMISKERILIAIELANDYLLKYFGIDKSKIAVAGLNPHAGEGGLFETKEIEEIVPAMEEKRRKESMS